VLAELPTPRVLIRRWSVGILLFAVVSAGVAGAVCLSSINRRTSHTANSSAGSRLNDRGLDKQQQKQLSYAFSDGKDMPFVISAMSENDESIYFAGQIESVAHEAGANVIQTMLIDTATPAPGIQIQFPGRQPKLEVVARRICSSLVAMGFLARCDAGPNDGFILICVGSNEANVEW
jgi:hypothetical protein